MLLKFLSLFKHLWPSFSSQDSIALTYTDKELTGVGMFTVLSFHQECLLETINNGNRSIRRLNSEQRELDYFNGKCYQAKV